MRWFLVKLVPEAMITAPQVRIGKTVSFRPDDLAVIVDPNSQIALIW